MKFLNHSNFKKSIAITLCFLCAVFFASRSVIASLNADYIIYQAIYNNLTIMSYQSCEGMEFGWCASAMLMRYSGMGYDFAAFVYVFLIYGLISLFLLRIVNLYKLSYYYIIVGLLIFAVAFVRPEMASHLTRQYIAAALLVLAMMEMALKTKQFWWIAIFAPMFHVSALCMFPVFIYIRYSRFNFRGFLVMLFFLAGIFLIFKTPFFNDFVDWGLEVNIEPRILYNILYKIKYVAGGEDALPHWKAAFLATGLIAGMFFVRNQTLKIFVYCYSYFLWLMIVAYFFSQLYFVRLFHYAKVMLFALLVMIAVEQFLGSKNKTLFKQI